MRPIGSKMIVFPTQRLRGAFISLDATQPPANTKTAHTANLPTTSPGTISSIQYLRGIAALAVVIFHANLIASQTFHPVPVIQSTAAGVDVFFVISGFIMWVAARNQNPIRFLSNRVIRVVPLYWLVTIALYVGWIAFGHKVAPIGHFLESLFFIPYAADNGQMTPLVVVGWTLNYEMFFYVLFAVALFTRRCAVLFAVIGGLVTVGVIYHHQLAAPLQFYTSPLLLEFALGVLLGMVFDRIPQQAGLALFLFGVAAIVLSGLAPPTTNSFWRVLVWGLPACCMVAGALKFDVRIHFLAALGDASYSIYLTHLLTIFCVKKVVGIADIDSLVSAGLMIGVGICASIAVGFVVYTAIERPIFLVLKRRPARGSAVAAT